MDGVILINKEKSFTSHDVVSIVKKITKSKVGHTGTLDPNATGVLPLLLGEGTKISKYLINHNKEYEAVIQLGKKTTTADVEGDIVEEKDVPNNVYEKCEVVLKSFIGKQKQVPPIYSAIKVNGKKLYDYARAGKSIEIAPRDIEIYDIDIIKVDQKNKQISFRVRCSQGTYIRSLCEDIAVKLGTVGFMKELKRTMVGDFRIENAVTIKELQSKLNENDLSDIISIEEIFKDNKNIELSGNNIEKYLNGVKISVKYGAGIYKIYFNVEFNGIGIVSDGKLKRDIVLSK